MPKRYEDVIGGPEVWLKCSTACDHVCSVCILIPPSSWSPSHHHNPIHQHKYTIKQEAHPPRPTPSLQDQKSPGPERKSKTNLKHIHQHPPTTNMSGAAQGDNATTKAIVSDTKDDSQPLAPQKPAAQLEEDDEFEDFPVEGMSLCHSDDDGGNKQSNKRQQRLTEASSSLLDWPTEEELGTSGAGTTHLWEESWDDDDASDEFSAQLKYVLMMERV